MNNIMLDLETMGNTSNAVIVAIGACFFNYKEIGLTFYRVVDIQSCLNAGLEVTGTTIKWWLQQNEDARLAISAHQSVHLKDALLSFAKFADPDYEEIKVLWGNGTAFDNVILRNAYNKVKLTPPWSYRDDRCYHTIRESFSIPDIPFEGTRCNALTNAKHQAKMLMHIFKTINREEVLK